MRLTVQPENLLEAIIFKLRKIPRPLLLSILGMGVSQVLFTAVRLNLFDRLKDTPKTAVELAKETDCDLHGMQVLLESLDGFGFLHFKGGKYQLTPESSRWLTDSGDFIKDFLRLGGDINRQMVLLEEDVRTGKVPNFHFTPQSPTCCSNYLTMLKGSGRQSSPRIIKWAKLNPAPQRLLDVAGGPAEYSIAFCQQYPNLKADILDLPYAAREGKARIEKAGLSDRIHYIEGNLLEEDWGTDYDVVFLSNILHCLTAQQCEIALKKAFAALGKGGKIIINDLFHPGTKSRLTSIVSLFSLIYYVTCGGRTWAKLTVVEWLEKTGFTNIRSARQQLALVASAEKP